jgi:hypothetical protein
LLPTDGSYTRRFNRKLLHSNCESFFYSKAMERTKDKSAFERFHVSLLCSLAHAFIYCTPISFGVVKLGALPPRLATSQTKPTPHCALSWPTKRDCHFVCAENFCCAFPRPSTCCFENLSLSGLSALHFTKYKPN